MKIGFTKHVGIMATTIVLLLPATGSAQTYLGTWDDTDGDLWIDHSDDLSITNAAHTNKYSFELGYVTTGNQALQVVPATGTENHLKLDLGTGGFVDDFLNSAKLQFDISVPAGTTNTPSGWTQLLMIINSDTGGWIELDESYVLEVTGDFSGFQGGKFLNWWWWSTAPERRATVTISYGSLLSTIGGSPGFVQLIIQENCGEGGQHPDASWQIDNVVLLSAPLVPNSFTPENVALQLQPTITGIYTDGSETVDTNNVIMTLDGNVVPNSFVHTNSESIISYTPTNDFTQFSVHTAKVVVASSATTTWYTNEWSFQVVSTENITYLDASDAVILMATSPDGPVGAGTNLVTNGSTGPADGIWRLRDFGMPAGATNIPTTVIGTGGGSGATVLESTSFDDPPDNCPRLKVSASGLDDDTYHVYVYFWHDQLWPLRAGLEDTPGTNTLTDVTTNGYTVAYDDGGRRLQQVYLGMVSGTQIDVYVEDLPATGNGSRTWFDGIGYEPVITSGPTVTPNIQGVSVSAGSATLIWDSELGVTYSILHKTNLTDATWAPVKTDIVSGGSNTMDSVTVSGADREFFMIEGE